MAANTFTSADEDRMHLNISGLESMLTKYRMTPQDLLTALRYGTGKFKWDEMMERAVDTCVRYDAYHDVAPEITLEMYD